ncbi:radical SAM protein [Alphaproteobacteria bacterium]|nr:radical SAM protein [Alphaproteobacteria bacterium]
MLNLKKYGYKQLNIETLGNCNMNCQFCNWNARKDKETVMPENIVYRLVDEAGSLNSGCESINFSQFNEPLLDKRIFDFISYTKKKQIFVKLTSNCLLLGNRRVLNGMINHHPDQLFLSVQTLDKKKFSEVRGTNMSHKKYKEIIFRLLSNLKFKNCKITMDMACNFLNHKKKLIRNILGFNTGDESVPLSLDMIKDDLIDFLMDLQDYDKHFKFKKNEFEEFFESLSSDYRSQACYNITENIDIKIKRFMYGKRLVEFEPTNTPFSCKHPTIAVMATGHVVPCCHMSAPYSTLGSVKLESLGEILERSKKYIKNLRDVNLDKPLVCKRCFGEKTKRAVKLLSIREKIAPNIRFNVLSYADKK